MRRITGQSSVIVAVALVGLTAPIVRAQQQAVTVPAPQPDPIRAQVESFERSLRGAIDAAAAELTKRVRLALPGQNIALQYKSEPVVTGWMMQDVGPMFHVLIPAIEDLSLKMIVMNGMQQLQMQRGQRVANDRVGATGAVVPDPALPSVLENPDLEYTTLARESLYNALLDSALSLPVPPNQHVTVIAGELPSQPVTPFYQRSRMLILQLKGDDLLALKQDKITREEAKARIKETRFPN